MTDTSTHSSPEGDGVTLVLITAPDAEVAERIGHALVDERLATCVNLVPGLTSLYRWDDAVQRAGEILLIVKTTTAGFARLRDRVLELHPYDVPEILDVPVRAGEPRYLDWVREGVGAGG